MYHFQITTLRYIYSQGALEITPHPIDSRNDYTLEVLAHQLHTYVCTEFHEGLWFQ